MTTVTSADTTTDDSEDRSRLAQEVRSRRLNIGLSVRAAAEAAGVARGTWIALEDASRRTAEANWSGVERALSWNAGSIEAVLKGGTPVIAGRYDHGKSAVLESLIPHRPDDSLDDPVVRIMRNNKLSDGQKAEIIRTLLREQQAYARRRVEELIREAQGD